MDERYTDLAVHLESVTMRCKANESRLDDHEEQLKDIRTRQDAIYELTSSVKSIATDMNHIKEDVKDVKNKQTELNDKVTVLENRPASESKKRLDGIMDKLIWLTVGGLAVQLLSALWPNVPW